MKHDHGGRHSHHSVSHGNEGISDRGLVWAAVANVALTVLQVMAGAFAGSIALIADALHNLNDALSLVVAAVARRIARRRADAEFTFGYRRAELIGATINLTALIVVGLFLVYEAVRRLFEPSPVSGEWVMAAAGVALVVDTATAILLWATSRGGLNLRAVFVHNLTDALASVAVLLGGAGMYFLGWNWLDPTLTLAIAGYVLVTSVRMLRRSTHILMEGAPRELDVHELRDAVEAIPEVAGLHHLHVWELDEEHRALEAHVVLREDGFRDLARRKDRIRELLRERFAITHSTLEVESQDAACREQDADLIPKHG